MRFPKTLSFIILATALVVCLPARAQQKPFTQEQVSNMVRAGLGDDSGAKLIEQRGIDFSPAEEFIQTLKSTGASEAFIQALRTAKSTGPASAKQPLNADECLNSGNAKAVSGDWDGAIGEYSRALEVKPDFPTAYYNRGNAKHAKGDLDGAMADFSKAIELQPDLADAYNNRGYVKKAKGDLDGAIADFSKAIELKPDAALAYTNRGDAKQAKGDMDGASADYAKAAAMESRSQETPAQTSTNLPTPPGTVRASDRVAAAARMNTYPTSPSTGGPTDPGTYYKTQRGFTKMEQTSMVGGGATHMGKMFVPGLTPQMVYTFRGAHSDLQTDAKPSFCIVQSLYMIDVPGRSNRDVVLVRFDSKKDHRELQVASGGSAFTFKAGFSKERTPDIVITRISDSAFTVTPAADLKPGDYLITFGGGGTSGWDFTVSKSK